MQIKLKTTHLERTPTIEEYVDKKLETFGKLVKHPDETLCDVEIAFREEHGGIFYAEINICHDGDCIRATAESTDVYAAIDEAKDEVKAELIKKKDKNQTLLRKGQRMFKRMIRGED